ncbi:cytochrome b/b6 domain-containing protein [Fuscovulum blasticum]|uniref:cytochrome b/b6 domain-containing protein n=1 Tax=Fuscovulum blasticum TaxID=1075 RepID=UPI000D3ECCD6|nr:cytochrome b/b6 domain-containing protein [Fuscovulum blasticum]AWD23079.1 cytochrome B [Fuscovulum blasticum]
MVAPLESPFSRARIAPSLWDPVIRISHWGLALVVLCNAILTEGGSTLHVLAGWIGIGLLALRLLWGIIGPQEARFSAFPPNPMAALRHLRQLAQGRPDEYGSHNPAGAMMAYVLWALLAVVIATGLVMTGGRTPMQVAADQAAVASGDWSALVKPGETGDDEGENEGWKDAAEEVHEVAANLILFLVLLHVAGVALESRAMGRNLVRPMLTGSDKDRRK